MVFRVRSCKHALACVAVIHLARLLASCGPGIRSGSGRSAGISTSVRYLSLIGFGSRYSSPHSNVFSRPPPFPRHTCIVGVDDPVFLSNNRPQSPRNNCSCEPRGVHRHLLIHYVLHLGNLSQPKPRVTDYLKRSSAHALCFGPRSVVREHSVTELANTPSNRKRSE
jgi:hypothetical protein